MLAHAAYESTAARLILRVMRLEGIPAAVRPQHAEVARDTLGGANEAAAELPGELGSALLVAANDAFAAGFQISAVVGTLVLALLAIDVAALVRQVRPAAAVEVQAEAAGAPVAA